MGDRLSILFSDKLRWLKIALPLLILAALCVYSGIKGPELAPHFSDYLKDPDRFDGTQFMVQFTMVKEIKGPERFVVADLNGRRIDVVGSIPSGSEECFISFEAIFKAPGYLILQKPWHIYSKDRLKLYVSAIALLGVMAFFLRRFRFNLRRFCFEARR
ncbi:hypothetical protein J7M28_03495 [bacterium]|nr:hypothetical protein [bacterium]